MNTTTSKDAGQVSPQRDEQSPEPGNLVLSRHAGESIVIGDDIEVHVFQIKGGIVRLNVRAPKNVPVRRGELPPRAA